jgi:hypothetical protein
MTPEEVWRRKTDEDVIVALMHLGEYTEVGRRVVRLEAARRGLTVSPIPGAAPPSARARREWVAQADAGRDVANVADPPPEPGTVLLVVSAMCVVWCVFLAYLLAVGFPTWEGFGSNEKIGAILTALLSAGRLLKEWKAHFDRKAAWERRQHAEVNAR